MVAAHVVNAQHLTPITVRLNVHESTLHTNSGRAFARDVHNTKWTPQFNRCDCVELSSLLFGQHNINLEVELLEHLFVHHFNFSFCGKSV